MEQKVLSYNITWDPLLNPEIIAVFVVLGMLLILSFVNQQKLSSLFRFLALCILTILLCNPMIEKAHKELINNVVILAKDTSSSNQIEQRQDLTQESYQKIKEQLSTIERLSIKEINISDDPIKGGTYLTQEWIKAKEEISDNQLAVTIFVSDGIIHDSHFTDQETLQESGPFHTLITGQKYETDRYIKITKAPRYGIVGKDVELEFVVYDLPEALPKTAFVTLTNAQTTLFARDVTAGETIKISIPIDHPGGNIFTLETPTLDNELTSINNTAILSVEGVRDRLKVLLVSGRPHNGGRVWRNLLKSDHNVELVHFTILRTPEKSNLVPSNELALIPFPVEELFEDKINDFDLIIFDRFSKYGFMPITYMNNIANFIKEGGAFLDVSGPESNASTLFKTQLDRLLPASLSGTTLEEEYKPHVTEKGTRHPITQTIAPLEELWDPWYRQTSIHSKSPDSHALLSGINDIPLLLISEVGQGRVAQFTSDQIWLWAKAVQNGGPHQEILRRLSHWLMKEPELEANRITAQIDHQNITLAIYDLETGEDTLILESPTGEIEEIPVALNESGSAIHSFKAKEFGVYKASFREATTVFIVGDFNTQEFSRLTASDEQSKKLAQITRGNSFWLEDSVENTPDIRMTPHKNASFYGRNYLSLRDNQSTKTISTTKTELFSPPLGLALSCFFVILAWIRERK